MWGGDEERLYLDTKRKEKVQLKSGHIIISVTLKLTIIIVETYIKVM